MRPHAVLLLLSLAIAPVRLFGDEPASGPTTAPSATTSPVSFFDPARHMKVSEVRPGMKGYGLTVLSGTKIDRFDVEVISTLHNSFGPKQDVVMIRCLGEVMAHLGPIAGCSGSPIYLYDDSGKARLIGAYAFGFDTSKDPIVGVQPIEYMMTLVKPPAGTDDTGTQPVAGAPRTWSLLESSAWRAAFKPLAASPTELPSHASSGLKPLMVPLAVRGASAESLAALRPMFRANGFEPMLAIGASTAPSDGEPAKIEPGSVLGAAVLSGDLELTALGTCTEVIDGRAFGFGHPFNGEGATSIPMGPGSVGLVMPLLTNSFKLGGLTSIGGAIDFDGTSGVAGQLGAVAETIPIDIEVNEGDGVPQRKFHYQAALHRTFTPMMVATSLQASVVAGQQLPVEHTVSYRVTMKFAGGRSISIDNLSTSLDSSDIASNAVWPVAIAMENPYGNVAVESVSARVDIKRGVNAAMIENAFVAQPVYKPGETARINVRLRKYKGQTFMYPIDVPLPDTLKDGEYTVKIEDATSNMTDEASQRPDRFLVRNVNELFSTMDRLATKARNDAMYVRLAGIDEGVAIGRTQLAKLPQSRRVMLGESGRPDVAALADVRVSVVPMDTVINGVATATIRVKKKLP